LRMFEIDFVGQSVSSIVPLKAWRCAMFRAVCVVRLLVQ
jgi:hypothetical protein